MEMALATFCVLSRYHTLFIEDNFAAEHGKHQVGVCDFVDFLGIEYIARQHREVGQFSG